MSFAIHGPFEGLPITLLAKGKMLFHTGEPVRFLYLVIDGQVDLIHRSESGARIMLFRAGT